MTRALPFLPEEVEAIEQAYTLLFARTTAVASEVAQQNLHRAMQAALEKLDPVEAKAWVLRAWLQGMDEAGDTSVSLLATAAPWWVWGILVGVNYTASETWYWGQTEHRALVTAARRSHMALAAATHRFGAST